MTRKILAALLAIGLSASAYAQSPRAGLDIQRNGDMPSAKGPAQTFTGAVRTDMPFQGRATLGSAARP